MPRDVKWKLSVLADAAKYDASCASSTAPKRDSRSTKGIGSTGGSGICHAYTPDGRCISLLKILLTNFCMFDCRYCVNRASSNVQRARFTVDEVVNLTMAFYKRNYIEGLFLSSGIIKSSDYTMEQIALVAEKLRTEHKFRGYIHLKTIPDADPALIERAGRVADRLSINIELPTSDALERLAPEKRMAGIKQSMARLRQTIDERHGERRESPKAPRFVPAGQSTQVIVGADKSNDADIMQMSGNLYSGYRLKRVYYSAFSPIPDSSSHLPLRSPPLIREHRLYQADWLYKFYGFTIDEIVASTRDGMLDLAIDPKLAWALQNRAMFPIDINTGPKELLLRVPGLGARAVQRILATRRHKMMRLDDVARVAASVKKLLPWICALDWTPGAMLDADNLRARIAPQPEQLELFAA